MGSGTSFAEQYAREARPSLDTMEGAIFLVGAVSSVLVWAYDGGALTWGWVAGWLVGQANVALLRRLIYRVLVGGLGGRLSTAVLAVKMFALLAGVFGVLSAFPLEPLGFAGGFTATVIGLIAGSMIVAARLSRAADEAASRESMSEGVGVELAVRGSAESGEATSGASEAG